MAALGHTLREFMRLKNLNAKQLADGIGVQPSSISHILTGRNEAGLDFLRKLIRKYPDADLHFLLTGEGSPIQKESADAGNPENAGIDSREDSGIKAAEVQGPAVPERILLLFADGSFRDYQPA